MERIAVNATLAGRSFQPVADFERRHPRNMRLVSISVFAGENFNLLEDRMDIIGG
jgi:hypothetical protein